MTLSVHGHKSQVLKLALIGWCDLALPFKGSNPFRDGGHDAVLQGKTFKEA